MLRNTPRDFVLLFKNKTTVSDSYYSFRRGIIFVIYDKRSFDYDLYKLAMRKKSIYLKIDFF